MHVIVICPVYHREKMVNNTIPFIEFILFLTWRKKLCTGKRGWGVSVQLCNKTFPYLYFFWPVLKNIISGSKENDVVGYSDQLLSFKVMNRI